MQIREIKIYILQSSPEKRSFEGRVATMEKVPSGLSGLFTHSSGFGGEHPEMIRYEDEAPQPTWTSMLRLVTDGDLDAYGAFGNVGEARYEPVVSRETFFL